MVVTHAKPGDWFLYFDADERIEYDFSRLTAYDERVACVYMKLFDFYITPEDMARPYAGDLVSLRKWCGPEYRPIMFLFKHAPNRRWRWRRSRMPDIDHAIEFAVMDGYVRHYGKCISISHWEDTCDFYTANAPHLAEKWRARKGKAVHTISDFGNPLITWEQREVLGVNVSEGATSLEEMERIRWWPERT